jgi:hypothetical protein
MRSHKSTGFTVPDISSAAAFEYCAQERRSSLSAVACAMSKGLDQITSRKPNVRGHAAKRS